MHSITRSRLKRQSGNALLEFAVSVIFLAPMALGVFSLGMGLARYVQITALARNVGSMWVRGADFSTAGYKKVLGRMAAGLGMTDSAGNIITSSTGNGVVIFSTVMRIGAQECTTGGFASPYTGCTNRYKAVVIRRVVVGNSILRTSRFANPAGVTIASDGSIPPADYLTKSSVVVDALGTSSSDSTPPADKDPIRASGENVFIAETYFRAPELYIVSNYLKLAGYYACSLF